MPNKIFHISLFAVLLALSSCTGTRYLSENEYFITNSKLNINDQGKGRYAKELKFELQRTTSIRENWKFLWMRPRLSFYNMIKAPESEEQKFKRWLKEGIGEKPQLYSADQLDKINKKLEAQLFNAGYFNSTTALETKKRKREISPEFTVNKNQLFVLDTFIYENSIYDIDKDIVAELKLLSFDKSTPYNLSTLITNRQKLAHALMDRGYYYFKPDHLEYIADTNIEGENVKLIMRLKRDNAIDVYQSYQIKDVTIEDNFILHDSSRIDTQLVNDIVYISPINYINPRVVANTVHLRKNDFYSRQQHIKTLNHIRALNTYQFVNIFYEKDSVEEGKLNSRFILVPLKKMSFNGEVTGNIKSNSYAGPGIMLSFLNRNTFKGAEVFNIGFGGRFETQIGQQSSNFAYEVRTDANLNLPRFYPFRSRRISSDYMPKTLINLGAGLQERVEYFQMLTTNLTLTYIWQRSERLQNRFSPGEIILSRLLNQTDAFREYLLQNPSVRRSFEEQFILGMNYEIFIRSRTTRRSPIFLGLQYDMSGNAASAVFRAFGNPSPTADEPYRIFNSPYAQYIRLRSDFRYTQSITQNHQLALRTIAAMGFPYGNSSVMPYIKQYFMGGPNSLRGFPARSLGPGTYQPNRENSQRIYVDQTGDIKLEANVEYRFPFNKRLKGAFFTDVGNIWLVNADSTRPGGQFKVSNVLNELAVSSGFGLRLDFNPILIRFDMAWPMRYPYKREGKYWVVDEIEFLNNFWRKENLLLNISLGYPF